MEEIMKIAGLRVYPTMTADAVSQLMEAMEREDSREIAVFPDPSNAEQYKGILLGKYFSPEFSNLSGTREVKQEGNFVAFYFYGYSLRRFTHSVLQRLQPRPRPSAPKAPSSPDWETADPLRDFLDAKNQESFTIDVDKYPLPPQNPMLDFLKKYTPARIEAELNQAVIGQPELTRAVADFLYYHALRQIHPQLPQRPLLISGPSGSGKTEVWRRVAKLYGSLFPVSIIDGSSLSCDGWAGGYKLSTFVTERLVKGGILVVDEFDKLTKPKHTSSGDNVSLDMQAEFLKLLEGEYQITEKRAQTDMTSARMGFVMVGAFEELRRHKQPVREKLLPPIGFFADRPAVESQIPTSGELTDEDFIDYGIMPEIIGRIATRCSTSPLSEQGYLDIIRGPHSRVHLLEQILKSYGVQVSDVISREELEKLVSHSKSSRTGVRWVCAQVENRLLEAIREQGLFPASICA